MISYARENIVQVIRSGRRTYIGSSSTVVFLGLAALFARREEFDRWETLDTISLGQLGMNSGIDHTQFHFAF